MPCALHEQACGRPTPEKQLQRYPVLLPLQNVPAAIACLSSRSLLHPHPSAKMKSATRFFLLAALLCVALAAAGDQML